MSVSPHPTVPPPVATPPPPSTPTHPPRLTRSRDDRVVAGVAGGIAHHLGVDPVLVRIAFVIVTLAGGWGVLGYLVGWLVLPEEPAGTTSPAHTAPDAATLRLAAGGFLVLMGLSWLLGALLPNLARYTWPVALIAVGSVILLAGARR